MTELLQVVDENNQPVAVASRDEIDAGELIARVAHIIVTDESGRLLCQKRAANVKIFPGRYTSTGSGHIDAGETNEQAAVRELSEEAGIRVSEDSLKLIHESYLEQQVGNQLIKRFHVVFHAVIDSSASKQAQRSEVSELRWFTREEIAEMLAADESQFSVVFQRYFHTYFAG